MPLRAMLGSGHAAETQTSLGQLGLRCRDAELRSGWRITAEGGRCCRENRKYLDRSGLQGELSRRRRRMGPELLVSEERGGVLLGRGSVNR